LFTPACRPLPDRPAVLLTAVASSNPNPIPPFQYERRKPAVTYDDSYLDEFEYYEERFNPLKSDRKARRSRKPRISHPAKKSEREIMTQVADPLELEGSCNTTYRPSRYEEGWLLYSLQGFFDQGLISDVLAQVKGGKEANVYCCQAAPALGVELVAAKVYRPRMFRNLRNDKTYREGRAILTAEGHEVKKTDHRVMRAIGKKTAFGVQVEHTSWLMYEYTALERLYRAGAAVPKPFASGENAILMGYVGDADVAAPTLNEIGLDPDEAASLFPEVLRNVELMLKHHLIHGDLSAYNILYWAGTITLIDFPQVTNSLTNRNAYFILQRDVTRICEYFARQGAKRNAKAIADVLWRRYVKTSPGKLELDDFNDLGEDEGES
jgi:RIO kinase 1